MDFHGYDKNFRLDHKVALITGGAAGIGHAFASLYLEKGATLALLDLSETVHDVAERFSPGNERAKGFVVNLTNDAERAHAVAWAVEQFGRIDILVNNAGVALLDPALEVPEAHWDRTLDLNLKALFF